MSNHFAAGASASLNKTITAMERALKAKGGRPSRRLRQYLLSQLGDLAVKWYRKGFRRGHRECLKQGRHREAPATLRYEATREFFTGDERTIQLKSTVNRSRTKG